MRTMRSNWSTWVVRAVGVIAALAACGPAQAFYWQGWPGSQLLIPPTLLTPIQSVPSSPASEGTIVPPGSGSTSPPVGPQQTPEPATGLLGLMGVGALVAVKRWRKKISQ